MFIVERRLAAYNQHDLGEFMGCFATSAWIEDGVGNTIAADLEAIRDRYKNRFEHNPRLQSTLSNRIADGQYMIDDDIECIPAKTASPLARTGFLLMC